MIHVGDAAWNNGSLVEENLMDDVMKSVAPWLEELLEHYRVLIYNGQLDIIVAYPLTEAYLKVRFAASPHYSCVHSQFPLSGAEMERGGSIQNSSEAPMAGRFGARRLCQGRRSPDGNLSQECRSHGSSRPTEVGFRFDITIYIQQELFLTSRL